jgi:predicted nuclease of predicted toxin-antitoxin system
VKLLVDMNLPPEWSGRPAQLGYEAVHWSTIGAPTADDAEILAWARDHGFVVLTHDLDLTAILAATSDRAPSVVQLRLHDILAVGSFQSIVAALSMASSGERGALVHWRPVLGNADVATMPTLAYTDCVH